MTPPDRPPGASEPSPARPSPQLRTPRLLVTRRLPASVEARLAAHYGPMFNAEDAPLPSPEILARSAGVDGILATVGDRIDCELIAALPDRVRIIATFSAGTDHIDRAAAGRRGITLTNTPDVLTDATAEVAMLLLLGAARRAYEGEREVREGRWSGWRPTHLLGIAVTAKRLGIVGMGRIGRAVAERARGFRMEVHYTGRHPLPPEQAGSAIFHAELEAMLAAVDFVSLHCPSTPQTRGMIDARRIGLMRPGAVLVNTARGDLVDDEALIAALQSGRLGAAGLDVYAAEPALDRRYLALPNTFLLPHLGSATMETREAMGHRAIDNLDAFFAGRTPPDLVL